LIASAWLELEPPKKEAYSTALLRRGKKRKKGKGNRLCGGVQEGKGGKLLAMAWVRGKKSDFLRRKREKKKRGHAPP